MNETEMNTGLFLQIQGQNLFTFSFGHNRMLDHLHHLTIG